MTDDSVTEVQRATRRMVISAITALVVALPALPARAIAQRAGGAGPAGTDTAAARWDVTLARGKTRDIDFTTSEGTWMSADISAAATWVYFDLLGHMSHPVERRRAELSTAHFSGRPDDCVHLRSSRPEQSLGDER
jgi:hypothetical protein